jgi:hypothetical protein
LPGTAFYYLIGAENCFGKSSLGLTSSSLERPGAELCDP